MMATGGLVVVAPNGGNIEYLTDKENCLMYEQGNILEAVKNIEKIVNDEDLRKRLVKNGLETVNNRDWENLEKKILNLYN